MLASAAPFAPMLHTAPLEMSEPEMVNWNVRSPGGQPPARRAWLTAALVTCLLQVHGMTRGAGLRNATWLLAPSAAAHVPSLLERPQLKASPRVTSVAEL